jgi:hypothetical protein
MCLLSAPPSSQFSGLAAEPNGAMRAGAIGSWPRSAFSGLAWLMLAPGRKNELLTG